MCHLGGRLVRNLCPGGSRPRSAGRPAAGRASCRPAADGRAAGSSGKLRSDLLYGESFAAVYGSAPERENVLDALAAFQRSLSTPNARFDRYLAANARHNGASEERGYQLFKAYGCVACHQGVNVGGNLFQKFGIFSNPFAARRPVARPTWAASPSPASESDRHVFRVPSLRNVARHGALFHDGRAASLGEAVEIMATEPARPRACRRATSS